MRINKAFGLVILALFVCSTAFAQINRQAGFQTDFSRSKKNKTKGAIFKRLSVGYGQHFAYNTVNTTYQYSNTLDTNFNVGVRAKKSMSGYINTYIKVANVSPRSVISLDLGFTYTGFTFQHDSMTLFTYNKDSLRYERSDYREEYPVTIMSVPISVDFRTGGEATLSKEHRTSFAGGIGVAPSFVTVETNEESQVKMIPFIKAEAGFFLGIEFKLRGMMYLGQANYLDNKVADGAGVVGTTARKSSGGYGGTISLAIMPFSMKWDKPF
jgi:hypothetical protein